MPDRRTLIVLACLIGSMTLISSLLLVLEPGPIAPPPARALTSQDTDLDPQQILFSTDPAPEPGRWQRIAVHVRGPQADPASLEGYHFVVRGHADDRAAIECSYRWTHQRAGAYQPDPQAGAYDRERTIGVCLVAELDDRRLDESERAELVWLVRQLQGRFGIGPSRVQVVADGQGERQAVFPLAWFRQNLLVRSSE